jgi:hypothetical protein
VVGEILVKFQPDANNDAVRVIEEEGCEAVLPRADGVLPATRHVHRRLQVGAFGLGTSHSGRLQQKRHLG